MARRHAPLSTIGSFETLEPRNLMSATTTIPIVDTSAEIRQILAEGESAEVEMQPREVYSSDAKQDFWRELQAGQGLNLNTLKQYTSRADYLPSPENPVHIEMDVSLAEGDAGLTVVTRTDGVSSGRFDHIYATGLAFTVECNGASIYLRSAGGGQYVGTPIKFPQYLQPGKTYRMVLEDAGTNATLRILDEGKSFGEIRGDVLVAPEDGGVVMRKGNPAGPEVLVPSLTVSHGVEPVPQTERAQAPVTPAASAVDAVWSDAETVRQLLLKHLDLGDLEVQDQSHVLYNSENKQEFWQELQAGQGLNLSSLKQYTSRAEMIPTPENPVRLQTDFVFTGDDVGIKVVTRTDGISSGRFDHIYANGLAFSVENNGASIYLRAPEGERYIGTTVKFAQYLETGKRYTLTAEDLGSEARLTISSGGEVVAAIRGAVPDTANLGRLVFRANSTGGPQVRTPSITVMHGEGGKKAVDAIFSEEDVLAMLCEAAAARALEPQYLTSDDPRMSALQGTSYESGAVASVERDRLYRESRFFVQGDIKTIAARHPEYGKGNGRVDGDIEADLNIQLGAYQDVVGDALLRGIGVEIADLKGQPREKPMEMLDFVLGQRARGRYISELSRWFQIGMPSKDAILAESRVLLAQNADRLIANQTESAKAVAAQNWKDTHMGDTPSAPRESSRALELNMARGLRGAMVHTASVIPNYSAEVRREFENAVTYAGLNVQEMYAEAGVGTQVLGESIVIHSAAPETSTFGIRTDTVAGQALIGLIHRLNEASDALGITDIAKKAEEETAIPWWKIAQAAQSANGDKNVLAGNLIGLFNTGGFSHLQSKLPVTEPQFLSTHQHKAEYRGEDMVVRFDLATAGKEIDHTFAYLIGHGGQIGDALPVEVQNLSVKIPAALMKEKLGDQESAHVQVKIVAWFKGEGHEGRISTTTEGVMWKDTELENALNVARVNPRSDYDGHLGADYPAEEGTPVVWNGPRAKVVEVGAIDGYGTMAVMLEIELPEQRIFQTEVDSAKIPQGTLMKEEIASNKIRVIFGHLRPSKDRIDMEEDSDRFKEGLLAKDIGYNKGEWIEHGTILGFIESKEYGGKSTGPHTHVASYDASNDEMIWMGVATDDHPFREKFIRPENLWQILEEYIRQ